MSISFRFRNQFLRLFNSLRYTIGLNCQSRFTSMLDSVLAHSLQLYRTKTCASAGIDRGRYLWVPVVSYQHRMEIV